MSLVWLECLGSCSKNYNKPYTQTKQPHIKEEDECMAALGSYILFYIIYSLIRVMFPNKTIFCDRGHILHSSLISALIRGSNSRIFNQISILRRSNNKFGFKTHNKHS